MRAEVSQNMERLNSDLGVINKTIKQSDFAPSELELMFIMDCTGSMSSWIKKCQDEIIRIVQFIKDDNDNCEVKVSFVGYRDFDMGAKSFSVLDFTYDI